MHLKIIQCLFLVGGWLSVLNGCGTPDYPTILRRGRGSLISPGYPDGYTPDLDCYWRLEAGTGQHIHMWIIDIELESGYDYLWLYDGPSTQSARSVKYTGSKRGVHVTSSGSSVLIRFTTDSSGSHQGFRLRWTVVHGSLSPASAFTLPK